MENLKICFSVNYVIMHTHKLTIINIINFLDYMRNIVIDKVVQYFA